MMLAFTRNARMYSSPFWVGYKQLQKLKGRVEKGEKGTPILIPQIYGPVPKTFRPVNDPGLFQYIVRHVYNLDQCAIPERYHPKLPQMDPFDPIEKAEQIIAAYKHHLPIYHTCEGAHYNFKADFINMPKKESFVPPEEYYGTLFHEIIHSTGHSTRLKRSMKSIDHLQTYSREELIAEFGACFLAGEAQILPKIQRNSVSYLQGWVRYLQQHEDELLKAAIQGARAANYVLGKNRKKNGSKVAFPKVSPLNSYPNLSLKEV